MKVWIINPFDNLPLEGYRPMRFWLMAYAFCRNGDDVTLWTGDFSHFAKKKRVFLAPTDSPPFRLRILPVVPYKSNVSLKRLYSHWKLARTWKREAEKTPCDDLPDVIISSSPPLTLTHEAGKFAKRHGAKFAVDIMDAWPETFERVIPRCFLAPLRCVARKNYRSADLITAVAHHYEAIAQNYGCSCPVKLFYHGIDMSNAQIVSSESKTPNHNNIRLVYAGNLGISYDLRTVLHALAKLPESITVTIAGTGGDEDNLRKNAAALGISNRVVFAGYLDSAELQKTLATADIGIIPMNSDSHVGIPYKMADYSKYSLAIASSLSGESAALINEYKAGAIYDSGSPDSLVAAIRQITGNLKEYKENSGRMCREKFDASKIYATYVDAIHKILSHHT